jgi:hypothetical protein
MCANELHLSLEAQCGRLTTHRQSVRRQLRKASREVYSNKVRRHQYTGFTRATDGSHTIFTIFFFSPIKALETFSWVLLLGTGASGWRPIPTWVIVDFLCLDEAVLSFSEASICSTHRFSMRCRIYPLFSALLQALLYHASGHYGFGHAQNFFRHHSSLTIPA